jgi:hypothetical protein
VTDTTALSSFEMYISKVSVNKSDGGVMHFRATASDTSPDLYQERMSNELYDDFVKRIETKSQVPSPFDEVLGEDWKGGMPYLSVSHYKSGTDYKNVPGMPTKIYRDGDALKATGTLNDNDLGRAVFKSLCDDLYTEKAKELGKIRISIGFLDLEHKHAVGKGKTPDYTFTRKSLEDVCPMCLEGIGNKVYTKGQLVHLALTRVPVNPRTNMEVAKAMAIETKKQDAESIVGKELSDTLEEKSLVSDILVVKSEEVIEEKAVCAEDETSEADAKEDEAKMKKEKKSSMVETKAKVAADKQDEELTYDEPDEDKREERRNRPAGERSLLQKSFETLESKIVELKSQGVPAETALREIQPAYNALGESIKKSLQPEQVVTDAVNSDISELKDIVKSLAASVSTLQQTMSTEIATLKAQTLASTVSKSAGIPTPRSLSGANLPPVQAHNPDKPASISELAYRSTFLR